MIDYAQLTLYHKSIRMSPFELLKGYKPRTSQDQNRPQEAEAVNAQEQLNQDKAVAFAKRMHDAWETAKQCITLAQQKKEREVNKHRRPVDFKPKDLVQVRTKNQNTNRPSKKLFEQITGL